MDDAAFSQIIALAEDYRRKQTEQEKQDEIERRNKVVRYLVTTAYKFGYSAGINSVQSQLKDQ